MRKPKVLIWDLETLPNKEKALEYWVRLNCKWKNVTMTRTLSSIICIGWKWHGEKKVNCINAWDYKNWKKDKNDDSMVVKEFMKVMNQADAMVTHNGGRFDLPFLNTANLFNKIPPVPNMPHYDTKKIASKKLALIDNRLDTVSQALDHAGKLTHTGWQLWVDTWHDKSKAKKLMTKYCKRDVQALEEVYNDLLPFMSNSPNYNLFNGDPVSSFVCPSCGSSNLHRNGTRISKTQRYQRYLCGDCGSSSRTNIKDQKPVKI